MNIAVLLAGGKGNRFGAVIPKQFIKVHGKPVILYSLLLFQESAFIDDIIVVCADGWQNYVEELKEAYSLNKLSTVIKGGESRFQSIYNAIIFCSKRYKNDDILLIHDSVRPCITEDILMDSIEKARQAGAALAAAPCFDTMYISVDGLQIEDTYPRSKLFKGQTPISIRTSLAVQSYDEAINKGISTDAPAVLLMQLGYRVVISQGSQFNIKITLPEDIQLFRTTINGN